MASDFLGQGWNFPVDLQPEGRLVMSDGETNVEQAIWIILATTRGSRVMRPDFGCGIHDLVFAVNDTNTATKASEQVREALVRWEPRIEVLDVRVEPGGQGELLMINLHYRVRTTNNRFNLVYPFYLER